MEASRTSEGECAVDFKRRNPTDEPVQCDRLRANIEATVAPVCGVVAMVNERGTLYAGGSVFGCPAFGGNRVNTGR